MKRLSLVVSREAPSIKNAAWLRPVEGGCALYMAENGTWKPMKIVDDNGTVIISDDTVENKADKVSSATNGHFASLDANGNLVDSGKSSGSFDTHGAAATAKSQLLGTAQDDDTKMTLYGLKAYIDAQIAALTPEDTENTEPK